MFGKAFRFCIAVIFYTVFSATLNAQNAAPAVQQNPAVTKFFDQLQRVFGKFEQADLQEAFEAAERIRCPELVEGKGDWKPVAFFNDNRALGSWYHQSLEEVKGDLRQYSFSGACTDARSTIQVTTKFPVLESIDLYNNHDIRLEQIDINLNPPVDAVYDSRLQSYSFDLPYMFLRDYQDGMRLYSLTPAKISERDNYQRDVIDHWDCKSVREKDVTYQFLICRVTLAYVTSLRSGARKVPFGAAAYSILSDGKQASAKVRYSFEDSSRNPPED
jgi:hypothetical protein